MLQVDLDHLDHAMQVDRNEMIGMVRRIVMTDILVGLERAGMPIRPILLYPLPPCENKIDGNPPDEHHQQADTNKQHPTGCTLTLAIEIDRLFGGVGRARVA